MTDTETLARRAAEVRDVHVPCPGDLACTHEDPLGWPHCNWCESEWPCDTAIVLARLEAQDAALREIAADNPYGDGDLCWACMAHRDREHAAYCSWAKAAALTGRLSDAELEKLVAAFDVEDITDPYDLMVRVALAELREWRELAERTTPAGYRLGDWLEDLKEYRR